MRTAVVASLGWALRSAVALRAPSAAGLRRLSRRAGGPAGVERAAPDVSKKESPVDAKGLVARAEPLPYGGVLVKATEVEWDAAAEGEVEAALAAAVDTWRSEAKLSAWVQLPVALARFAAVAARLGFDLHHADAANGLVMYKWLSATKASKVPPFPRHQIGCAGFVMNPRGEILVVREWTTRGDGERVPTKTWKLPGGLADAGESLFECAARETFEETGVQTRGQSVLGFWHRHDVGPWALSDIYAVVKLELDDEADTSLANICPDEISAAKWCDLTDFVETQDHPLIRRVAKEVFGVDRGQSRRRRKGDVGGASPLAVEKGENGQLDESNDSSKDSSSTPITAPLAHLVDLGVQWPGRPRYATYFPKRAAAPTMPPRNRLRALASDVDGTLLTRTGEIHPLNVEAITSLCSSTSDGGSFRFFVATGKCRAGARAALGPALAPFVDDGVFVNGLVVYAGGEVIFERVLGADVVVDCVRLAADLGFDVVAYCRDDLLCERETEATADLADRYFEPRPRPVAAALADGSHRINKVLLLTAPETVAAARPAVEARLNGRASLTTALPQMLEVLPPGASKREGVAAFCAHFGIDEATELAAVGDGENDAEMLHRAAFGIAVGNAGDAARNAADIVVDSNDEAGAATAIRLALALALAPALSASGTAS